MKITNEHCIVVGLLVIQKVQERGCMNVLNLLMLDERPIVKAIKDIPNN